jgi:hypothetical protein
MAQAEIKDQNSPTVVTVMTTEHFVLQTARSAGITETNGRAGFYLAAVSSGLIALAFTGQLSRLGTAFYVFGLVLLPTLAFVGVTTFERALRNGVEDVQLAGRSTGSASSTSTPRPRSPATSRHPASLREAIDRRIGAREATLWWS